MTEIKKLRLRSEAYKNNELDANKQMIKASHYTALFLLFIWIFYIVMYITKLLDLGLSKGLFIALNVIFPFNIGVLISTWFVQKTPFFKSNRFKYYVLVEFVLVMTIINTIIPKHAVIGWAIPIALANHYYNPKFSRKIFILESVCMLLALYGSLFLGEYDKNLFKVLVIDGQEFIPDTPRERWEFLHLLITEYNTNRYLDVFFFYYLSRILALAVVHFISMGLSRRTYLLLENEIQYTTDKKAFEVELNVAHDIQHSALPSEINSFKNVTLISELQATKEVGGDLYDYFQLDDNHIALVIGDVSGKGVPAAMFMMKTLTCFKTYTSLGKKPSEILALVNRTLYDGNDAQMFVTCFFGILDTSTGILEYANAGHNRPIVGQQGKYRYLDCATGFILGGLPTCVVKDEKTTLEKGDTIFLYTDGITEARNTDGNFFGEEKLLNVFNKKDYPSILDLNFELKDSIKSFVNDAEQSDDIAYLFMLYQADNVNMYEKAFKSDLSSVNSCIDFLNECLEKEGASHLSAIMSVVMDELCSNIARYAYEPEEEGFIYARFTFNVAKRLLTVTLLDKGIEFNPLKEEETPLSEDTVDREVGGLGLLIVKQSVNSISYSRINNKNILVIKKTY